MSPVVIFLTDGEPNSGVTNPQEILRNVQHHNKGNEVRWSVTLLLFHVVVKICTLIWDITHNNNYSKFVL